MTATTSADGLWHDVGPYRYVGTAPNTRFPAYTRGNAGEVFPEVVYPLSFSLSGRRADEAMFRAMQSSRLIDEADRLGGGALCSGVFGGYTYLNLSILRVSALRTPGGKVADVDAQYTGSTSSPPYRPQRGDRRVRRTLAAIPQLWRTVNATSLPHLDDDEARVVACERRAPDRASATDSELVAWLEELTDLGVELFEHHIAVSGQATIAVVVLQFCEKRLGDASLGLRLLGGLGDVPSATPSSALWTLGRLVAADPGLTARFAAGVTGLWDRLQADPEAAAFCEQFRTFLAQHGSRGPNEWETACPTWGTTPDLALALVDRMRLAPDDQDPQRTHERLVADRTAALAEAESRLRRPERALLRRLLRASTLYLQSRERAKTTVVAAIHLARLASIELARRAAGRARAAGVTEAADDDLWFVIGDELDAYLGDPAAFATVIAERRHVRDELSRREPPFAFDGTPPPWESWPRRDRPTTTGERVAAGAELTGLAGSPGVARGIARIVTDPGDPTALGPGEILVAPLTDPAWTPLFVPAGAVVVDVGAVLSHAVIVARELGIPAVVSVVDATRRIPDGALVEVDGSAGIVRILEVP